VKSRLRQVVAFARSASLTKSFVSASQVFFFASVVVSFGWSNWVLPKIEFVVKCCQEGCGSGSKARSLCNPKTPNKACSRLVGFVPAYRHFSGFGLFLLSKRISSRPPAANANRWAAQSLKRRMLWQAVNPKNSHDETFSS